MSSREEQIDALTALAKGLRAQVTVLPEGALRSETKAQLARIERRLKKLVLPPKPGDKYVTVILSPEQFATLDRLREVLAARDQHKDSAGKAAPYSRAQILRAVLDKGFEAVVALGSRRRDE